MQRARPFDMIALRLSALALAIAVGLLLAGVAAAAPSRAAENGNLLRSGQAQALQPERAVTLPVVHTKRAAAVQSKSVASELSAPIYVTQYSQPSCQSTNGIFSVVTRLPGSCISLNGGTYYIQVNRHETLRCVIARMFVAIVRATELIVRSMLCCSLLLCH